MLMRETFGPYHYGRSTRVNNLTIREIDYIDRIYIALFLYIYEDNTHVHGDNYLFIYFVLHKPTKTLPSTQLNIFFRVVNGIN